MTMGPGGGSDPGNKGSSGGGSGKGSTGGGGTGGGGGFGRDTPGAPDAKDGKRGSTMGPDGGVAGGGTGGGGGRDGRGENTPGAPSNDGRRGTHAEGSTPSSRARDAMSRHQQERDRRSIANGGAMIGDNDDQAGLGVTHATDSQQTENSLNRAGVTDTLGMDNADRLGAAVEAGAALSSTERQQARGIVAGHRNQFAANRVNDIMGVVPGVGLISDAMVSMSRPSETMEADYSEGRQRANDTELGAIGEAAVGYGMAKTGVTAPMGPVNFGQAIAQDMAKNQSIASLRDAGFGSGTTGTRRAGKGGNASTALQAMKPTKPTTTVNQTTEFGWNPVDVNDYSQGLMSLAQTNQG